MFALTNMQEVLLARVFPVNVCEKHSFHHTGAVSPEESYSKQVSTVGHHRGRQDYRLGTTAALQPEHLLVTTVTTPQPTH